MQRPSSGLPTVLVVIVVLAGFAFILYQNAGPSEPLRALVPTQVEPTDSQSNTIRDILQPGFGNSGTPLPTIGIPEQGFVAATLVQTTAEPLGEDDLISQELFTVEPVSVGVTPTRLPPTTTPVPEGDSAQVQQVVQQPTIEWQAPALPVPQSRDPRGWDHYFFGRPIDPDGQNFGVFTYPYGSDGHGISPSRIHHGIDMPNEIGKTVRAAGSGTVIFASQTDDDIFQGSTSYGRVVAIEHDFGWNGEMLTTVYAHLQASLVQEGDYVELGQPIGLNGNTGRSSGPHLHFEVRVGGDRYGDTLNPALWVVPYEQHGTIAGQLLDEDGNFIDDVVITLRDRNTGLLESTVPTYIFDGTVNQVNSDPNWQENFVFADVPVGRYQVVTTVNGVRLTEVIDVFEGLTTPVTLQPETP